MKKLDDIETIKNMSWEKAAELNGETTVEQRYQRNIEDDNLKKAKAVRKSNSGRKPTQIVELSQENLSLIKARDYLLFQVKSDGIMKDNIGLITGIEEIEGDKLRLTVNCNSRPEYISNSMGIIKAQTEQPVTGIVYIPVQKPRNYKKP